ncbi:hypothetical protein KEM52_002006, partial [Ascosphaera acerosa]
MGPSMKKLGALLAAAATLAGAAPTCTQEPRFKDPNQPIHVRVNDLLDRMSVEDKMAQLIQGDIQNWMNDTDLSFNYTGLVENMKTRSGSIF